MIDSVTLWISNLMLGMRGRLLGDPEILDAVVRAVRSGRGVPRLVPVTTAVGSRIVPADAKARRFAAEGGAVHLGVAGLSIRIR